MTKKLILLILALPLFLMICLFTATSGVSLAVPISVSGIELISESTVYLDLDNPKDQHLVEYAVYPTNAANQDVSISYLPLEDENGREETLAKFEYDEETGYLKPLAPGAAEVVLTTVDGGYTARFTAIVTTRELVSIESVHPNLEASYDEALDMVKYDLEPGDTFKIENNFEPVTASNLLVRYESSDPTIATVNARGVVQARSAGTVIITVTSRANEYISYSFALEIKNPENQSIVIVDKNVTGTKDYGSIDMSITTEEEYELTCDVVDSDGNIIEDAYKYVVVRISNDRKSIEYYFADSDYYGTVFIDVTLKTESGEVTTIRCSATKTQITDEDKLQIVFDQNSYDMYLQTNEIFFQILPDGAHHDLDFVVSCSNENIVLNQNVTNLGESFYSIILSPQYVGTTDLSLTVTNNETGEVITRTVPIIVKPTKLLADNPGYSGIEGSHTIGKYNADGSLYEYYLKYTVNDKIGDGFYDHVKWTSSNDGVYVDADGKIVFVEGKEVADFVTFQAVFAHEGVEVKSQAIKIRCIFNGYNVTSYKELLKITREGKVVVLQNDIVYDFGVDVEKSGDLESPNRVDRKVVLLDDPAYPIYTTMKSTYDTTWYQNQGRDDETYIKVLISFKEDVYGNGHEINADNVVSYGQWEDYSSTGQPNLLDKALFRGPLSFVGLSDGKGSGGAVTVAAQDNICFAVYDNVTLNNIELTGRNMDSEDGSYNLQQLHYAGTVVEVFGDVNIEYSRVRNGRNVIRAFGDDTPFGDVGPDRNINLTITNSVLSSGRDFIMRVGSNKFVDGSAGDKDALSPYLKDSDPSDRVNYSMRHSYDDDKYTDAERQKYDEEFIRTFVTLKNSVLEDPGIFGIGVDTHFAGTALHNGENFKEFAADSPALNYWKNMAKTSYGVKLTLSGDVRMYCWKTLNTVDSTSLIETMNGFSLGLLSAETLAFDIPDLVRAAVVSNSNLQNVVYNPEVEAEVKKGNGTWMQIWGRDANTDGVKEMQEYDKVHAGIVFFGGGKNYSVLDYDNFDFYEFSKPYEISLADAGRYYLTLAAGNEDFYFVLYDSTTLNFLYEKQDQMRKDPNEGYSCLYKK